MKVRLFCLLLCGLMPMVVWAAPSQPRVVALSWEPTEHLLRLGVTPMAVADAADYRKWVVRPALPESVPDIGTRAEPNLELLAQLHPDLIIISPLLADIRSRLERIAPVVLYEAFSQTQDNLQLQRRNFLALAEHLGRRAQGQAQLQAMDDDLERLRQGIQAQFHGHPPKVAVVRFTSPTSVLINGPNSMPEHALRRLGLAPAYGVPVTRWGLVQVPVATLGSIDQGVVLYLEPFDQRERLFRTALWQNMPFVRGQRFASMGSVWTHGGVFCVQYLAEAISTALKGLPEAPREKAWEGLLSGHQN